MPFSGFNDGVILGYISLRWKFSGPPHFSFMVHACEFHEHPWEFAGIGGNSLPAIKRAEREPNFWWELLGACVEMAFVALNTVQF